LKAVALTTIFPFIGLSYIQYQISNHSLNELRALRYKFNFSENEKNLIKNKKGLIKFLLMSYKKMSTDACYQTYINPFVENF